MTETYDLTNPITDALGDEHTLREVTMTNHSTMTRIEPLTNTEIPAGQTVLVRVVGDIGHEQLISQIQQINELKGFEVIGVTSVAVGGGGSSSQTSITNGTYKNGVLTYIGGTVETPDGALNAMTYHYDNTANDNVGELVFNIPLVPHLCTFFLSLGNYSLPIDAFLAVLGGTQAGFHFGAYSDSDQETFLVVYNGSGTPTDITDIDTQYSRYFLNNGTLTRQIYNKTDHSVVGTQVIGATTATLANLNVGILGTSLPTGFSFNFEWLPGVTMPTA